MHFTNTKISLIWTSTGPILFGLLRVYCTWHLLLSSAAQFFSRVLSMHNVHVSSTTELMHQMLCSCAPQVHACSSVLYHRVYAPNALQLCTTTGCMHHMLALRSTTDGHIMLGRSAPYVHRWMPRPVVSVVMAVCCIVAIERTTEAGEYRVLQNLCNRTCSSLVVIG